MQRFGQGLGAFSTAALLYGGAAWVALFQRRGLAVEAPLRRSEVPRLLAMVAAGAVVGSVPLAWGLQRTSCASASLLLTLEAVFTAVLTWRWYGEVLDVRVKTAVALLLALDQGGVCCRTFSAQLWCRPSPRSTSLLSWSRAGLCRPTRLR